MALDYEQVNQGGWPGPMHMGNVATDPGGTNAQGTGKKYKGPKGFFQYGHGQYGYVNPYGKINWQAKGRKGLIAAQPVLRWADQQLMNRPESKIRPPYYANPDYFHQMAQATYDLAQKKRNVYYNIGQMRDAMQKGAQNIGTDYAKNYSAGMARLGGRGLSRSGMTSTMAADLERQRQNALFGLQQQFGTAAQRHEMGQLKDLRDWFNTNRQTLLNKAREAWAFEHPGKSGKKLKTGFIRDQWGNVIHIPSASVAPYSTGRKNLPKGKK